MIYQKIAFTWFLCLLLNNAVFAQSSPKITWSIDNDLLPQNSVKSIIPDKYGYLWLTTENGLVRFDGKNYTIYNSQNLKIKSNRMLQIQGNSQTDTLFVTTDVPEDLILIHKRNAVKVNPRKIKTDLVYLKQADGIYNSFGFTPYSLDLNVWSYRLLLPSKNYYLIKENTIEYYSSTKKLLKKIPFEKPETKLFFTIGEKLFYLKNENQYAVFDKGNLKWKSYNFKLSSNFKKFWNKPANQVFLFSENNLYAIHEKKGELFPQFVLKNDLLQYNNLISVYQDTQKDIVFLGSSTNGLGTYKTKPFKTISIQDTNQSSILYASKKFTDNTILTSSGLEMNKDTVVNNYGFKIKEKIIMGLDKNKNVWLKTGPELYFLDKSKQYKNIKTWRFQNRIGNFFIDSSEKAWITLEKSNTKGSRLLFFNPNQNPLFYNYSELNFHVNYMQNSNNGIIWLATSKGLYSLNTKSNILKHIKGTSSLSIRSVLETGTNEVWIATYGQGFYLYKDKKLYRFPLDKNQYLATAHYFMEDKNGFFWIPTNKGLFQVKKDILLHAALKNPKQRIYYHYYNKESGFLTNEFNGGSSPHSSNIGTQFFLPSMNGMVTFDTQTIKPEEPKSPIYIDEIWIDNKIKYEEDYLYLPNNYQRIIFSFSSPYFDNELNSHFEVKLEGPSEIGWTPISSDNKYSFTKLSAGTYTLTVRKLGGFDSKYIYKKMQIEIAPRIYEKTWFRVLIVVLSSLLIYFSSKIYIKNVKRRNRILVRKIAEKTSDLHNTIATLRVTKDAMKKQADKNNKLIQIISHDIKSPLKFMSMASKYMYEEFDPNHPDLKENILAIHTSSSQIYNFLDNILSYSKVNTAENELENERFLLVNEVHDKIRLFKNIANAKKTFIVNSIPKTLLLNTNRSLFAIILHNLLDNALKNTLGGVVEFSAKQEDDTIFITIGDKGTGMNAETLNYYQSVIDDFDLNKNKSNFKLGLHLVIELMIILNGKITLKSQLDRGTTIILEFSNQAEIESS